MIVSSTAEKSAREKRADNVKMSQSINASTATMIVAARTAFGRKYSAGVNRSAANAIPSAVSTDAICVSAPASKLTTEREKPPVTGNPPDSAAAALAAPKPINSWFGSIRCLLLAPNVFPTDTDSTNPMRAIKKAGMASSLSKSQLMCGALNAGSPVGT